MQRNLPAKALAALALAAPVSVLAQTSCADLARFAQPDLRITRTSDIRPDPLWLAPLAQPPGGYAAPVRKAFCRVEGVIEDEIGFELWLPRPDEWTGRMLGTGNGGHAGFFRYEGLARGVNRGMAASTTDTGHKITDNGWALNHPRRVENYGHRAQHLLAVNAKKIIAAYYGKAPLHNYFMGCSGGGMQAMNEVQKYPADYDGIIAGAHGQSIVGISARWLQSAMIAQQAPAAMLADADWKRIADTAVKLCDGKDGLTDGIIERPYLCRFDMASTPGLTPAQVQTARQLLGPVTGKGGSVLFPAFTPGVAYQPISSPGRAGEVFAHWLYNDAKWDFRQFDAGRDVPMTEAVAPGSSPTNPNLAPFFARGGKMISYHGWNDPIVPAQSTLDYWRVVQRFVGADLARSYKLYLPAGMDHCRGGIAPDNFGGSFGEAAPDPTPATDMLMAMIDWVEQGREPGRIDAVTLKDGKVAASRPICPWPQFVRYKGRGEVSRADSYVCVKT